MISALHTYIWRLIVNFDQSVNTVFGGKPDETISSRLGKAKRRGSRLAALICIPIDFIDPSHCATSIEEDE